MPSKTPNFDKALDEILKDLKPHTRKCGQCGHDFEIFKEDIDFYHKLRVPPPKMCPLCRMQRRMMLNTSLLKFYRKDCAAHKGESAITLFPPESPYKIYDNDFWWNPDAWDARDFGIEYDSAAPFLEQFTKLALATPHFAIARYHSKMLNSDYTSHSYDLKNCFLSSMLFYNENVNYSSWVLNSRDSFDLLKVLKSERCYHLIDCDHCYNSIFLQNSSNCIDSFFLFDCHNCQHCFMSSNLRHKSYCFFNEPLTKEEYEKRLGEINLGHREVLGEYKKKFEDLISKSIHRAATNHRAVNSIGERLDNVRKCFWCFEVMESESNRYIEVAFGIKDSMDIHAIGPNIQRCYQVTESKNSYDVKFSYYIDNGVSLEYCFECADSKYCFGCIGLRKKQFCILNKQYSEAEYWEKVDEIKLKMLQEGSYGDFFLNSALLYPYNNTLAFVEFPLSKEDVINVGFSWHNDEEDAKVDLSGKEVLQGKEVPEDIKGVRDDILNKVILCEETARPFQIIKPELEFHKQMNLPLPTKHPQVRLVERFQKRNPYRLWKVKCAKCGEAMYTSYAPELKLKVYCEKCYIQEVI